MHGSIINGIWPRSLDEVNSGNVFPGPFTGPSLKAKWCCGQQPGRDPMLNTQIYILKIPLSHCSCLRINIYSFLVCIILKFNFTSRQGAIHLRLRSILILKDHTMWNFITPCTTLELRHLRMKEEENCRNCSSQENPNLTKAMSCWSLWQELSEFFLDFYIFRGRINKSISKQGMIELEWRVEEI